MQFNKALYLKELKQHRVVFAVHGVLTAIVAVMLWMNKSWFSLPLDQQRTYLFYWMKHGLELFLPALLIYSWFHEQQEKTSYQLLSLPVKSPAIIQHKYLAFCTAALAASLLYIPGLLIQSHSTTAHPITMGFALFLYQPLWQILLLKLTIEVIAKGQKYNNNRLLYGMGSGGAFFLIILIFQDINTQLISADNLYLFHTHIDTAIMLLLLNLWLAVCITTGLHRGLSRFEKNIDRCEEYSWK